MKTAPSLLTTVSVTDDSPTVPTPRRRQSPRRDNHRLLRLSDAILSRVKTMLKSGVICEKKQRFEVIDGGLGIH
mgnify:CR=1 FL=1